MIELSLETIAIIAHAKLWLAAVFLGVLAIVRWHNRPWLFGLVASVAVVGFYVILSRPLATMWWGNNGDEIFIVSFLSQVMAGNPLLDFYYHGLPAFYPPLYFWLTGGLGRFLAENAIGAAKLGVMATLGAWFIGTYAWQRLYWRAVNTAALTDTAARPWFWVAAPLMLFFMLDFNDIILKPYETLPALGVVLLVGLMARAFAEERWTYRHYLFFGLSGGLLFLFYYFWWFMAIPALVVLALLSGRTRANLGRLAGVGGSMFAIAAVYIIPLFMSYAGGMENWQALFFVPTDFSTFLPFAELSWRTIPFLLGLAGLLLYYRRPAIKATAWILVFCYGYQYASILLFSLGGQPLQAAKPFLFLGTATLAVGAAYALVEAWQRYGAGLPLGQRRLLAVGALIVSVPFWPMTGFLDDSVARRQIEWDLERPAAYEMAERLKEAVPDYASRTWLTSGMPELNAYLPLKYYAAHNPHFSHPAVRYSERLETVRTLTAAEPADFVDLLAETPIDALLLYKQPSADFYPLFFWGDHYPNGGREVVLAIPQEHIRALAWMRVYEDAEWAVYVRP